MRLSDTLPSRGCISANAHALARYAALCQEQNIVPILEPEVLMDGWHSIDWAATVHLDAINRLPSTKPWKISFSYGRASDHALETWHGRDENLAAARQALYQRARCNSAASLGRYTDEMEDAPGSVASPSHRREWHDD